MPAKLREELGEHFTVTKGLDGCLSVYPEAEWKRLEDKIRTLGNGEKARRVKRYYFANAFDAQLDAQGRILIPANLRTFAEGCYRDRSARPRGNLEQRQVARLQ